MTRLRNITLAAACALTAAAIATSPAAADGDAGTNTVTAPVIEDDGGDWMPPADDQEQADAAAAKQALDADPLTAEQIEAAAKDTADKDRRIALEPQPGLPAAYYLASNHVAQAYNNYCGPATAKMTLGHQGYNLTQASLASRFGISPGNGGTSWDAMLRTLKAYTSGNYAGNFLAYSPSARDKEEYKAHLKIDIARNKDSIAGNVLEPKGSRIRLAGHPINQTIYHWVNIRGYKNSGADSQVQDPATSVWPGVRANSPVPSNNLVIMMGGRGYQW
ncbi:C39 family peptidase [Streptomyces sp. NRRL S-87]|uniref:C39 family peptidase n=1 Tax=Streptomyces sp. NRRL S-87 TaxID=1463920 RepID=UPI0004BF3B8E|nr:C39 family peptidase [Streptomyces sp. NRRL S-87]